MMQMKRLTGASLVVAALLSACSNEQFTAVNQSLVTVNKLGGLMGGGDARIPTAAISTAMGAMEMMKAFSAGSGDRSALISAGGQSYQLLQLAPSLTTVTETISERGVSAQVTYRSIMEGTTAKTTIEKFDGMSQGYFLQLNGTFEYRAATAIPTVSCAMQGRLWQTRRGFAVEVKEIVFNTVDPLPRDGELGRFELETKSRERNQVTGRTSEHQLVYKAAVRMKDGKIEAEATYTKDGVPQPGTLEFGENKIGPRLNSRDRSVPVVDDSRGVI